MAKRKWELAPWAVIGQIVDVLEYGSRQHGDDYWTYRPRSEYFAAALRHLFAWWHGESTDESGLPHLAHAAADVILLMRQENKWHE